MRTAVIGSTRFAPPLALLWLVCASAAAAPAAQAGLPIGDYQRAILVSWDGVSRDVLLELLEVSDPATPCWENGDLFPVPTGRLNAEGAPLFTCLPALGGAKPSDAPEESPAYGPFQILASHTTDDGTTMTKPQHASMLSGYNTESHGITQNVSKVRMPEGLTIYERLMDAFDPLPPGGQRNGLLFRTHHSGDRKYVGKALYYWAKLSRALQVKTGTGNSKGDRPGALRYAERSFERWRADAQAVGLAEPAFFMFLHFKTPDWSGHRNGVDSRQYRRVIIETDRKLYTLLEMLRHYGLEDTAVLVTTDHGFRRDQHVRNGGRTVFNTWMGAHNVQLSADHIPMRTPADYCASHTYPEACLAEGPDVPMPAKDVVPNLHVTSIVPTLLDMFGVEWRTTSQIEGESLYRP
jgi:hypothetical protein